MHWQLLDRGIGHVYIRPATPRLNGKVERSHRIDAEKFYRMLDGVVIDDTQLFNDKLPTARSVDRPPTNETTEDHDPEVNNVRQLHN